jgi:pyruvate/2-oxoglutarate dehydrogenase complex dihydrolipoamide acyltransferase (E2) component
MWKLRMMVLLARFWWVVFNSASCRKYSFEALQAADGAKNVSVGEVIALLAEEGDDISNLEAPAEEPIAPPPKTEVSPPPPPPSAAAPPSDPPTVSHHGIPPKHSRPLFPSVHRLLLENNVSNAEEIKGTGIRGMLTKGDVLAFIGKASSPTGTLMEEMKVETGVESKKVEPKVMLIVSIGIDDWMTLH